MRPSSDVRPPARLVGAAAVVAALSALTVSASQGPRIRFEETTHDFGKMRSDEKAVHRWVYHNDGDRPLEIVATRTSCGCTATVAEDKEVPPGGQGVLEVAFDAAGQSGSVRKTVTVTSNDPIDSVVILTVRAKVEPAPLPAGREGHPPFTGQSLLMGDCASCHAEPARGKTGGELYASICAMCHGERGEGGRAPSLRDPGYLGSRSDEDLTAGIAYGTANPRMPGFSEIMGGPLGNAQVRSLVELIRQWGPLSASPKPEDRPER